MRSALRSRHQRDILIEREIPAIRARLRDTGGLRGGQRPRCVGGLVDRDVIEQIVVANAEASANYGLSVVSGPRGADGGSNVRIIRLHARARKRDGTWSERQRR